MKKNKSRLPREIVKLRELWRDRKNQADYWGWLFSYAKPYVPRLFLVVAMNLSGSFLGVGMALVTKSIIDTATSAGGAGIPAMVALYVACLVASLGISMAGSAITTVMSEKFSFGIRKQIYEKIINSHWIDSQKFHTGDLMTRLTSDAGNIADGIVGVGPDIIKLVLELIITFFTLFYFSPLMAVFAMALAPAAAIISLLLGRMLKRLQVKVQESESAYRSFLQESLANLLIIKSFSNEDYAAERLVRLRDIRFHWVFKKTKLSLATSASMSLTFQLGYIVAFAFGAVQVSKKIITYGTMSVFINLVSRIQAPVYLLAQELPKIISMYASAGRVIELQDIPAEERREEKITSGQVGVKISGLTFGYVDEPVFENASMEIHPGEFVAIIGESGIGKTTLVRLLMSFISDVQGIIEFYGERGEVEASHAGVRRFVSYVPQGNTLFSGTIRENIRMGKLDATEEEMLDALRLAAGYDFVAGLKQGLDTVIGERGHGLSEGQAQRIAIARALIKKAPLLILDEATSALDEKTELAVLDGVSRLEPKPTCLLITHRRSVLDYCDRSIKIEDKQLFIN